MIWNFENMSIFVRPGFTDMRKQANGLSIIVEEAMEEDSSTGSLFLFCSRNKKIIKGIWWDRNGFWLIQKRLSKGIFPWPNTDEEARKISTNELMMLLAGIDFWNAHKIVKYEIMN